MLSSTISSQTLRSHSRSVRFVYEGKRIGDEDTADSVSSATEKRSEKRARHGREERA